jgi:hypothetical protein
MGKEPKDYRPAARGRQLSHLRTGNTEAERMEPPAEVYSASRNRKLQNEEKWKRGETLYRF